MSTRTKVDPKNVIWVAVDLSDVDKATKWMAELEPYVAGFKLGLQYVLDDYVRAMTEIMDDDYFGRLNKARDVYKRYGRKLFVDLKFHDVSRTVEQAVKAVAKLGPQFINMHAGAGREATRLAVANKGQSRILAVTVLTSIDSKECISIFRRKPVTQVLRFVEMAAEDGVDGIICSPEELRVIRANQSFDHLFLMTPGIRSPGKDVQDQKRLASPANAILWGADGLVIGSQITGHPVEQGGPAEAARQIIKEIAYAQLKV